jgi:hypothetical protein
VRVAYSKTSTLESKPKVQRAIIADVLLQAERSLSFGEIVAEARKFDYEKTFKRGRQRVTIEESVTYHLREMIRLGTVKEEMVKD